MINISVVRGGYAGSIVCVDVKINPGACQLGPTQAEKRKLTAKSFDLGGVGRDRLAEFSYGCPTRVIHSLEIQRPEGVSFPFEYLKREENKAIYKQTAGKQRQGGRRST
ncbi:hypothetical protein TNIN_92211 [Trichonephila inaurata madagascariensis]|uniref:Uncharacterized protein n=1 Tax=Trichonephila inaurata madagascariensis TaxID=2747483 RepID=A0A8X6YUJ2_9ARAC|nr:hypothetical protein TNIN_92211 [Trichonephila inaurata madagascariensis]